VRTDAETVAKAAFRRIPAQLSVVSHDGDFVSSRHRTPPDDNQVKEGSSTEAKDLVKIRERTTHLSIRVLTLELGIKDFTPSIVGWWLRVVRRITCSSL
jgi:hypothetical protein